MSGNHFFQKLKGLLVKVRLSLSFGCMRLNYRLLGAKILCSFKQALKCFLKLNQRFIQTKPNPPHRLVLGV
ncbi:sodium:proton antiporter [Helicobacter pylori]|nr:sodium:proton antiporter [Helicobacter pylori]TPH80959.1 sodium:proton antiporter [Helicobacter pylori]TPI06779.1 sodium:proton antiporter [Helicobacter pylori]